MFRYLVVVGILASLSAQNYLIKFSRYRDGLSHANVTTVRSAENGLIWIGTESSLNQFDSKDYYRIGLEAGLTDDYISALAIDDNGNIWIGTHNGLNLHQRNNHHILKYLSSDNANSLTNNSIQTIYIALDGSAWIGTERGLNHWTNDGFERFIAKPDLGFTLRNDDILSLIQIDSNTLLIGTNGGGLELMDIKNYRFHRISGISAKKITDLEASRDGGIWISSAENGLFHYSPKSDSFQAIKDNVFKSYRLTSVTEDEFGYLWVGTEFSGLVSYHKQSGKIKNYQFQADNLNSISSNEIHDITTDPAGNVWIATSNGLSKIHRKEHLFKHYMISHSSKSAEDNMIFPIVESTDGMIWIGTYNGGLTAFNPQTETFSFYLHQAGKNSLSNNAVQSIYTDGDGIVWIGTFGSGLDRFDPKSSRFKHFKHDPKNKQSIASNYIRSIVEDRRGNLWIATDGGGLNRMNKKSEQFAVWTYNQTDTTSLSSNSLTDVLIASDERVWISSRRGLSLLNDDNKTFSNFMANRSDSGSISDNYVLDIFEDSKQQLWLATEGGGINRYNKKTNQFQAYQEKDGLLNNVTYNIVEDDSQFLWITTLKGLSRFNPETGQFNNFDERDGLQSNEFNSAALTKTRDGKIIAGGINGFNLFDPSKVTVDTVSPNVIITDFELTNIAEQTSVASVVRFPSFKEISLTYDHNNIYIRFIALEYRVPEKINYAFQLKGFNDSWVYTGNRNDASFTNLAPGEYTFNVKATTSDQVWTNKITSLSIIINPPFWASDWFRIIVIILIALVIYYNYKRRVRLIESRNRELKKEVQERKRLIKALEIKNDEMERFTYTVSHDLKSPLITIQSFLGALNQELSEKNDTVQKYINYISDGVQKMNFLLEDLLELSRVGRMLNQMEMVPVREMVDEAIANVAGYISDKKIDVKIDDNLGNAYVDRIRIVTVFQNLIDNAAKFMADQQKPYIHVSANLDNDETIYFIKDNGAGIEERFHKKIFELFERLDPNQKGTGIGLALVKRIIQLHEGRIWVESEGNNKGTTFYFTLKSTGGSDEQ